MNFVTYKEDETADNDANYFLVKLKSDLTKNTLDNATELEVKHQNTIAFEVFNLKTTNQQLPLYCFEKDENTVKNLNFTTLKLCKEFTEKQSHKFVVVYYGQYANNSNAQSTTKKFDLWHKNKPSIKFNFQISSCPTVVIEGEVMNIFYKEFLPETKTKTT